MGAWAQAAVQQGFVVLLIDSLGPRDVDLVCLGVKKGVNFPRGVRDALQAADHLRALPFVDKRRVAHVGFSWVAMVALLGSSSNWRSAAPGSEAFTAAVAVYPGCFSIQPKIGPRYEIVQTKIDRPILVLMGEKDTETPPEECVPKLQAAKDAGAPVEWYIFRNATHCWDCQHLNGFSKTDFRGTDVTYRYDPTATQEARRRSTGDGILATFDGPGRAVRCGLAFSSAAKQIGLPVRAGLHTGEIEVRGNDIGGIAVHAAARVMGQSSPDEVLVSRVVTDLVAGAGLKFTERGSFELKGLPGRWDLFEASGEHA